MLLEKVNGLAPENMTFAEVLSHRGTIYGLEISEHPKRRIPSGLDIVFNKLVI